MSLVLVKIRTEKKRERERECKDVRSRVVFSCYFQGDPSYGNFVEASASPVALWVNEKISPWNWTNGNWPHVFTTHMTGLCPSVLSSSLFPLG